MRIAVSGAVLATLLMPSLAQAATVREAQWFLDTVHAIDAQKITRGEGVTVCVLDTGVDASHPDLAGAVLPGKSFDSTIKPDATSDVEGHGTAMAGLIAARGGGVNNALGMAPVSKILPVATPKVGGTYAASIRYCVDNGAKVLNLSGGHLDGTMLDDEKAALEYAVQHDVVVVIAAGNRGQTNKLNPFTSVKGVVAVAGTTQSNSSWPDSWTGSTIALSAPAITVTTYPKTKFSSGYGQGGGTSDSTAIVSGTAALLRAKYPAMNAASVINRLIKSSTDLGAPGRDDMFGYGLVNAEKALTMDIADVDKNPLGEPAAAASDTDGQNSADPNNIFNTDRKSKVAGPIAGAVLLVVVLALVLWLALRGRKKRGPPTHGPMPPAAGPPPGSFGSGSIAGTPQPPQPQNPPATGTPSGAWQQQPGPQPTHVVDTTPVAPPTPGNVIAPQPQAPVRQTPYYSATPPAPGAPNPAQPGTNPGQPPVPPANL